MPGNTSPTITYKGRTWTFRVDGLDPALLPTEQELAAVPNASAVAFLFLYATPEWTAEDKAAKECELEELFPPQLTNEERQARNWAFADRRFIRQPLVLEGEDTAYDGRSRHRPRRALTPNERDLLCRLIRDVSGDPRYDSYGIDMARLLIIRNVVDPRNY